MSAATESDPRRGLSRGNYEAERVRVHDLLHERIGDTWQLSCSSYDKLRLAPQTVAFWLDEAGCQVRMSQSLTGMRSIVARRSEPVEVP